MQSQIPKKEVVNPSALGWVISAALLLFLGDRLIKRLAATIISDQGGFFYFSYYANTGGVFNLPWPLPILICFAGVALVAVSWLGWRAYQKNNRLAFLAAWLMFVGGYSNLLDRLSVGAVIDVWHLSNLSFNLADIYLLLGLGLMVL